MPEDAKGRKQWPQILIVVVLLAAAAGLIWYQLRASDYTRIVPKSRRLSDWPVDWRCLACGETRADQAGIGPRQCPKCGKKEAYVSFVWTCPAHGARQVAFQYDPNEDPSQVKVGTGDWVPAISADGSMNIHCPDCGAALLPPAR